MPVPISAGLLETAFAVEDRCSLSYWDCLIVAAAQAADCDYLLSEDRHVAQRLDTVIVINPFAQPVRHDPVASPIRPRRHHHSSSQVRNLST